MFVQNADHAVEVLCLVPILYCLRLSAQYLAHFIEKCRMKIRSIGIVLARQQLTCFALSFGPQGTAQVAQHQTEGEKFAMVKGVVEVEDD